MLLRSFSLMGLRADADFMMWKIGYDLDAFEGLQAALMKSGLGKYLTVAYSYFGSRGAPSTSASTRRAGRTAATSCRARASTSSSTRSSRRGQWYRLPLDERQRMMNEHMHIGRKHYPVKNNTAYCFGIDDYEFILSFEAESPEKFQDLMMELRESEASSYTELDTPIFTCRRRTLAEILEDLG